ncbi:hypothetical protein E2C01_087441 [Portunus trituberculatus]|uniref:Uncharacterized protein n=1 Tax=Portunus trituberculatus TaxID=210409 RepID=A0A5B7JGC7_PORTR|nr:hypothetical protein [Portunus trituberculatus]
MTIYIFDVEKIRVGEKRTVIAANEKCLLCRACDSQTGYAARLFREPQQVAPGGPRGDARPLLPLMSRNATQKLPPYTSWSSLRLEPLTECCGAIHKAVTTSLLCHGSSSRYQWVL